MSEFRKISLDNTIVQTNKSFLISRAGLQALRGQLITMPESETEENIAVSMLNTPVIDNLVFQAGSYLDLDGNQISYEELRIDAVIIEVTRNKNIVETQIQGRDAVVVEHISDGARQINIRGVINGDSRSTYNIYPKDKVKNLIEICKAKRSLTVTSTWLNEVHGINDITIKGDSIPQVEGLRNQQPFSINAIEDVPIDLEELEID